MVDCRGVFTWTPFTSEVCALLLAMFQFLQFRFVVFRHVTPRHASGSCLNKSILGYLGPMPGNRELLAPLGLCLCQRLQFEAARSHDHSFLSM